MLTFPGSPKKQKQRLPEPHRSFPQRYLWFPNTLKGGRVHNDQVLILHCRHDIQLWYNLHSNLMENNPVPSTVMIPITVEYEDLFLVIPLLQLGFKLDLLGVISHLQLGGLIGYK